MHRTRLTGAFDSDKDATRWDIQAGIAKNWFGIGNTVLYGEYNEHKNFRFCQRHVHLHCTAGMAGVTGATAAATLPDQLKGD